MTISFPIKTRARQFITAALISLLTMTSGYCAPDDRKEKTAAEELTRKGIRLNEDKGNIYALHAFDVAWSHRDTELACEIESLELFHLEDTRIESGALAGLQVCANIETVRFSGQTRVSAGDISDLKNLPRLRIVSFFGDSYGDEIMKSLGMIPKLEELYIQADDEGRGGSLTEQGIAVFAEARSSGAPIQMILQNQRGITDMSFKHFAQIEGLTYIDFGSFSGVTRAGVDNFARTMKENGQTVRIAHDAL